MMAAPGGGRLAWLFQAGSGLALAGLLGLHWVAQHYLAEGGLRGYVEVAAYLGNPWVFALEVAFLVVVTAHALLGVRALLLDLGLAGWGVRVLNISLVFAGAATVVYGISLLTVIIRQG